MNAWVITCSFASCNLSDRLLPHCSEWLVNQHRDSFATYIGHHNLVEFFAIAENESKARVKFNFLQVHAGLTQLDVYTRK